MNFPYRILLRSIIIGCSSVFVEGETNKGRNKCVVADILSLRPRLRRDLLCPRRLNGRGTRENLFGRRERGREIESSLLRCSREQRGRRNERERLEWGLGRVGRVGSTQETQNPQKKGRRRTAEKMERDCKMFCMFQSVFAKKRKTTRRRRANMLPSSQRFSLLLKKKSLQHKFFSHI